MEEEGYGRGKRKRSEVAYDETKRRAVVTQQRKRDMVDADREGAGKLVAMIAIGGKMVDKMSPMKGVEEEEEDEDDCEEENERAARTTTKKKKQQ